MSAAPPAPVESLQPLSLVADLSQALAESLDVERTLAQAVARIAACLSAEAVSVFLHDRERDLLECRACAGPVDVRGLTIKSDRGIVGRTFTTRTCQIVRDAQADPDFAGRVDTKTGFRTHSVICSPLITLRGPIGALQVLNKRDGQLFDEADRDLLRALAAPTALALSHAELVGELVEQERIRNELKLARRLQRSLLPKRRRSGFPILGVNKAAREVSGDFYDYFELDDGRIAFTVGDVAGKGLVAAMLMVRCQTLLRFIGKDGIAPGEWLARVNDELAETVTDGKFVCVAAGYYDPRAHSVEFSNAGFPPALLLSADDGRSLEFLAHGPPLAVLPGMSYGVEHIDLATGALYFFSDGATEARLADGSLLGMEGLTGLIRDNAGLRPQARLRALLAGLREHELNDDTTLLLIEDRVNAGPP